MKILKRISIFACISLYLLFQGISLHAQANVETATASEPTTLWLNGAFVILLLSAVVLMLVIVALGRIIKTMVDEDTKEIIRNRKACKGFVMLAILMLLSASLFSQDAAAPTQATASSLIVGMDQSLFWAFIGTIGIEFVIIMVMLKVLYSFLIKKGLVNKRVTQTPKWLQWKTMVGDDLSIENESELLTDHDYDGIQELDNGMPPMLKYIFVITIAAAIGYWSYYEMGSGPSQLDEYNQEMETAAIEKAEYLKMVGNRVDETTVKLSDDATVIASGQKIFATNCVACHGDKGQGGVGPNLTDNYWLHGGTIKDIFTTIKYGVPAKGMRSWQSEIGPADIQAVASYILTAFAGKNVTGGKAPQGEEMKSAPSNAMPADSNKQSVAPADSAAKK